MNIQFTPGEMKLIERLRKEQRRWPRTRWLLLTIGVVASCHTVLSSYVLYRLVHDSWMFKEPPAVDSSAALLIAMFWTKALASLALAAWCFSTAIIKWHGDVNRMLLLKLLDAQGTKP